MCLLHFAVERADADAERLRGARLAGGVPAVLIEQVADDAALGFLESGQRLLLQFAQKRRRQIIRLDDADLGHIDAVFDDVFQLAHVARPAVAAEQRKHLIAEALNVCAELMVELL